jgi:hypothetical protein
MSTNRRTRRPSKPSFAKMTFAPEFSSAHAATLVAGAAVTFDGARGVIVGGVGPDETPEFLLVQLDGRVECVSARAHELRLA